MFTAVDGVSFALERGKTLCVVGESGSGKSVTARSILQILDPPGRIAKGRILLHRHRTARGDALVEETVDLTALEPRSAAIRAIHGRDIAMIFQEPMSSLSLVHTIGNQIVEAIRLHMPMSKKEAKARAIELLQQVEIPNPEHAIDSYPFEYSGGMRQRAMIAMALACNPTVLIADEPTTALDVTTQAEILDLIRGLQERFGMAVMFITHDMGVVAEIADDVVVMRHGKLVERGPVEQIFHAPEGDYTKRLLGAVLQLDQPSARRLEMRARRPIGAPILELEKLQKSFFARRGLPVIGKTIETKAVVDADLVLHSGENLGIVGESGSGKTTLGRCILRVVEPSGGAVRFQMNGEAVDVVSADRKELAEIRRGIRLIFQDPFASLNPRMNVAQIVGEPLLVQGIAKGAALRERVAELLRLVGLDPAMMERYPHAFSGGQRQRIGIARAIALEPKVIVADEATSALDVSLRTQVLDLLLELQERLDLSFLFISHDISVIRYFCDRIAVMYRGRIVEAGPTERVCTAPEHAYTKALLGTMGGGALTAIEMALWDIKGKVLGQPVWNLLGGCFRDRIPVYGHAKTPERARELIERGYRAAKVAFTGAVDLDAVWAVREAMGPERDVMVDAHGPSWMTTQDAILIGRELEKMDLLFYEDPIPPEHLDGYRRLRDALTLPLAAGERVSTIWGIRPLIEEELVDVIQPDTGRAGGITQLRKMAAMAEAHGIMLAPHSGSLGPVAEFAALHVMATIPNALLLERIEFDWPGRYEVVTPVLKVEDGHLPLPTAPGLGVDLVLDEIAKYPSGRNVSDVPADDGWAFEPGTADSCVYVQTRLGRGKKLCWRGRA